MVRYNRQPSRKADVCLKRLKPVAERLAGFHGWLSRSIFLHPPSCSLLCAYTRDFDDNTLHVDILVFGGFAPSNLPEWPSDSASLAGQRHHGGRGAVSVSQ